MKKIYDQIELSFRKLKNHFIDTIVSDFLDIRSPSMGVPTVRAVQVDNTLNPGTSIEYGRAYILTDVSELHANFIVPANVADNDIVMWTGRFFKIVMRAADATAKGLVVKTYVTSTDEDYTFSDGAWTSGTSSFNPAADTVITGSWSFDIVNGGVQSVTTDDATLAAATYLFGMAYDIAVSPDLIRDFRYVGYGTVGITGYNANRNLLTGVSNAGLSAADSNGADASINVSANGAGDSQINILSDLIITDGVQTVLGHKTGTLAAPPANMLAGEAWADTTDSVTNPIYRICLSGT